ncbi:MAG: hypothetical protein GXY73_04705 [Methanothrix sp.]|nr:hypothetical protein [Methanothrix sp.]
MEELPKLATRRAKAMIPTARSSSASILWLARPENIRAGRAKSVTSLPKTGLSFSVMIPFLLRRRQTRISPTMIASDCRRLE